MKDRAVLDTLKIKSNPENVELDLNGVRLNSVIEYSINSSSDASYVEVTLKIAANLET